MALLLYLDTSVIGGMLDVDEPWKVEATKRFLDLVRAARVRACISDLVAAEVGAAPPGVRAALETALPPALVSLTESDESRRLAERYVAAGVVPRRFAMDARHVAVAVVCGADAVVSWNFAHLVSLRRIHAFNSVNLAAGYRVIDVRSPLEVSDDEAKPVA